MAQLYIHRQLKLALSATLIPQLQISNYTIALQVQHQLRQIKNYTVGRPSSAGQSNDLLKSGDQPEQYQPKISSVKKGTSMVKNIVRTSAVAITSLGLVAAFSGIAGASTGSINGPTGPDSINKITSNNESNTKVDNDNTVKVSNSNYQTGTSGDARVHENTTGGDATSGDVTNSNTQNLSLTVTNSSPVSGSSNTSGDTGTIGTTGPDSINKVTSNTETNVSVNNDNNVSVTNNNNQSGSTGDASVTDNTTGGSATSGSVSNTNSTSDTITISN